MDDILVAGSVSPAKPVFRKQLVEMMEGVEDIPGINRLVRSRMA